MRLMIGLLVALAPIVTEPQSAADQAMKEFKQAYAKAGNDSGARAAATRELGKVPDPKTLSALNQLLGGQETAEVRIAAAETLGDSFSKVRGAYAVPAAVAKLRDRKITDVRTASTKAVGSLRQKEGLRTLQDLADDKPFEIAREAIEGLAKIPDRSSVPLLIKLLREVERIPEEEILPGLPMHGLGLGGPVVDDARNEQTTRRQMLLKPIQDTLSSLTEQKLETYDQYKKWWSGASSSFKVKEASK